MHVYAMTEKFWAEFNYAITAMTIVTFNDLMMSNWFDFYIYIILYQHLDIKSGSKPSQNVRYRISAILHKCLLDVGYKFE